MQSIQEEKEGAWNSVFPVQRIGADISLMCRLFHFSSQALSGMSGHTSLQVVLYLLEGNILYRLWDNNRSHSILPDWKVGLDGYAAAGKQIR